MADAHLGARPGVVILAVLPALTGAQPPPGSDGERAYDPDRAEELLESHCGACHSLDLPKSQRLDRSNWEWVIQDMVEQFGCTWLTEEQQATILEYLVRNCSPDSRPYLVQAVDVFPSPCGPCTPRPLGK